MSGHLDKKMKFSFPEEMLQHLVTRKGDIVLPPTPGEIIGADKLYQVMVKEKEELVAALQLIYQNTCDYRVEKICADALKGNFGNGDKT